MTDLSDPVLRQLVDRLDALETANQRLEVELRAAQAQLATEPAAPAHPTTADHEHEHEPATDRRLTRRRVLTGGALAAAASTAAVIGSATPAAANAQGGSFTLGDPTNTATATTGVTATVGSSYAISATNPGAPGYGVLGRAHVASGIATYGAGVHGDSDLYPGVFGTSGSAGGVVGVCGGPTAAFPPPAGVLGNSSKQIGVYGSSETEAGVYGTSTNSSGVVGNVGTSGFTGAAGVVGEGSAKYGVAGFSASKSGVRAASASSEGIYATSTSGVGARLSGGRAALNLVPRSSAGRPTTGSHGRGDLVVDNAGALFLCTASGTPGTWVRVSTTPA